MLLFSHLLTELWTMVFFKWKWVNKSTNKLQTSFIHLLTTTCHYRNGLLYHSKRKKVMLYSENFWTKILLYSWIKTACNVIYLIFSYILSPKKAVLHYLQEKKKVSHILSESNLHTINREKNPEKTQTNKLHIYIFFKIKNEAYHLNAEKTFKLFLKP